MRVKISKKNFKQKTYWKLKMMRKIGKLFLQGLIAILPIALTIYILYWFAITAESLLGGFLKLFIPERYYVTGMAVFAGFAIILAIGLLLRVWLFRELFHWGEKTLEKLPLIKTLYGSIRDLMGFFDTSKKKEFNKVVMVMIPGTAIRLIGLVTREDFENLPSGINDKSVESMAVYLPMSYQMGGFTVFVPKKNVNPVDMSIEEAMRFALTAAVSVKKDPTSDDQ
jgi:uncharacterized membrane protein